MQVSDREVQLTVQELITDKRELEERCNEEAVKNVHLAAHTLKLLGNWSKVDPKGGQEYSQL